MTASVINVTMVALFILWLFWLLQLCNASCYSVDFPVFYFLNSVAQNCDSDSDTLLHATVDLLQLLYKPVYQHILFRQ